MEHLVSHVDSGEGQLAGFTCDFGTHARPSHSQPGYPGLQPAKIASGNVVAESRRLMVAIEHGADGKVCGHLAQVDHRRSYKALVHLRPISVFRDVAVRSRQNAKELRLQLLSGSLFYKLNYSPGILQDLHRFYTADFVKEPSATGV